MKKKNQHLLPWLLVISLLVLTVGYSTWKISQTMPKSLRSGMRTENKDFFHNFLYFWSNALGIGHGNSLYTNGYVPNGTISPNTQGKLLQTAGHVSGGNVSPSTLPSGIAQNVKATQTAQSTGGQQSANPQNNNGNNSTNNASSSNEENNAANGTGTGNNNESTLNDNSTMNQDNMEGMAASNSEANSENPQGSLESNAENNAENITEGNTDNGTDDNSTNTSSNEESNSEGSSSDNTDNGSGSSGNSGSDSGTGSGGYQTCVLGCYPGCIPGCDPQCEPPGCLLAGVNQADLPTINTIPTDQQASQSIANQNQESATISALLASRQAIIAPVQQQAQNLKYQTINPQNIPAPSTNQPPQDTVNKIKSNQAFPTSH